MAKILKIDSNYIANPEGDISLLIGLENTELLLQEVYYINSNMVNKPQFTKDIMPSSSWLSNELVIVGSIGGSGFGANSNVHFADTSNADMLKNMKDLRNAANHWKYPTKLFLGPIIEISCFQIFLCIFQNFLCISKN